MGTHCSRTLLLCSDNYISILSSMIPQIAKIHLSVLEVCLILFYPETVPKFWKSERHSKGKDVGMEHHALGVIIQFIPVSADSLLYVVVLDTFLSWVVGPDRCVL